MKLLKHFVRLSVCSALFCLSSYCQAGIIISLVNTGSTYVQPGQPFELQIRALLNSKLTVLDYQLSGTGEASAQLTRRTVKDLSFISSDPQQPLDDNLPYDLTMGPFNELLMDMTYSEPGFTDDGMAPGTGIVIETIEITPTSKGDLTISISDVEAATTDLTNPDGMLFDQVTIGNASITVTVGDPVQGDVQPDGRVDIKDVMIMASQWLSEGEMLSADIMPLPSGDGIVNMQDFMLIAENWRVGVE
jgi:hypothetical protein